ncbi:MAG: 50S ribosomal protein L10 [Bacillota bacterium]
MVRPEKIAEVEVLKEKLERANSVVLVDFRGINVEQAQELRNQCRASDVEYRVVKNTLLQRALDGVGVEGAGGMLTGPTALAISYDDAVTAAKRIKSFSDSSRVLEIKGGILEGSVLGADEVIRLADLPSRQELLAQVAACFAGPLTQVARVLQAPMRDLTLVTSQLREKRAG